MKKIQYSNKEMTIVWQPELCQHYAYCFSQLPEVFNPGVRKWIDPYGASSERIIEQVNMCPSGALTFIMRMKNNKNE